LLKIYEPVNNILVL